jgi:alkylation response protein AidB-like acyl-CoA dehydrogenase
VTETAIQPFERIAEHVALRDAVRGFLAETSPLGEVRRLMDTTIGYDPDVWQRLSQELGLTGLAIPEEYGGSGYGFQELSVVLEEMGSVLFGGPFFSTSVLAANALLLTEDRAACLQFLPSMASGSLIATAAVTESDGDWTESAVQLSARRGPDAWRLTGVKDFVFDGQVAQLILVAGRTSAGVSIFAVDGGALGLRRTPLEGLDQTRKLARLEFDDVPARLVGTEGLGWPVVERVLQLGAVGLAAEQVGGAQRCLDMAVDYAKTRTAFGRPIGSFQAVKHACADLLVSLESARSAMAYAAWCASQRNDELAEMASMAKSFCSETYTKAAAQNIQVHGGIGFTWEHPAHLYLKRAKSSELLLGDPAYHRSLLADLLGF